MKIGVNTLTATQAARQFSELLNRIKFRGESFLVERNGEVICQMSAESPKGISGAALMQLFDELPPVDAAYLKSVDKFVKNQPQVPESMWDK